MLKSIIFILFVIVLCFIGFFTWYFLIPDEGSGNTPPTTTGGDTFGSGGGTGPRTTSGTIGGTSGGATAGGGNTSGGSTNLPEGKMRVGNLVVNDFLEEEKKETSELSGVSYRVGDTSSEEPPYYISYYERSQTFLITLMKTPLGETRRQVEEVILTELGIDEAAACQLKHDVGTPSMVSREYAGKNLRFSFCPGAVQLSDI